MRLLLIVLSALALNFSQAFAGSLEMKGFERIPVQHEGRIKPLDTMARVLLRQFSGKESLGALSASDWMAETLFDPLGAANRPVFLIRNAGLRHRLGIPEHPDSLYSYAELTRGLGRTVEEAARLNERQRQGLNMDERELLRIHENALLYTQILRSFSLLLPLDIELPRRWDAPHRKTLTYLDLRKIERDVEEESRRIVQKKGDDLSKFTPEEQRIVTLSYQLNLLGGGAANNRLLRLIPDPWGESGEWLAPWALLQEGKGAPETAQLLDLWKKLAAAWDEQNPQTWNDLCKEIFFRQKKLSPGQVREDRIALELLLNRTAPFLFSSVLYALSLAGGLLFLVSRTPVWRKFALLMLIFGVTLHGSGIAARVILLERPPVGTLFESMLFVGAAAALFGLLLERLMKNGSGILTGSLAGLLIGILSQSFSENESLKLLPAVLDTRFWLATHVVCITLGYSWCIATAIFAHLALLGREETADRQQRVVHLLALLALLFTASGTILGGIWADQSWGRFWGWDPKENGALLIVLWLIWLLHGKVSGHLDHIWMLAGYAFLSVIVAFAWIGVNLLGVGLHSYGFTEGVMTGLFTFTAFELLLIGSLVYRAKRSHAT